MSEIAPATNRAQPVEIFFAFPDGVYDYVCAECTALCCKGHGLGGSLKRELSSVLARYPQLEAMAVARQGDNVIFATPDAGCLMLDRDNLCRIEKELGKDQKPTFCSLFPFNSLIRVGRTVVVQPHFLCPLRAVIPPRPGSVQGTHEQIENQIRKLGLVERDHLPRLSSARLHPSANDHVTIEREKKFRDFCAKALGVSRFTDVLTNFSADAPALQAFTERARCILGYNSSKRAPEPDALDGFLLAFASVYRIGVLDLTGEEILRALAVAEIMTRRVWSGLPQEPTLQGVANTLTALKPIQILLAHGDERFDFGKVTKKTFSFRDAELTFAAFIAARHAPDAGVFAALEQAIPPGMSIADRSVLLRRLGEIMQTVRLKPRRRKGAIVEGILSSQDLGDNRIVRELAQQ